MCGIAGILGRVDDPRERVRRMNDCESHRGPDDSGVFHDPGVTFGHRRLSILDPTPAGHQPMLSEDERHVVVFNGEIYNFEPLRETLREHGFTFRSDSDTEVLLYACAVWGQAAIERLNGDFAFAYHDRQTERTLLGRDRLGVKPLYYTRTPNSLAFASESRSLLASGLPEGRLDAEALPEYLATQSVAPPRTLVDDVRLLEPGHFLVLEDGTLEKHRYWDPLEDRDQEAGKHDRRTACRQIRRRLENAIERQMVSDVPLGAFLSGGIDSTTVVGLMSQSVSTPIRTVALTFDDAGFDDGYYARMAADHFGTEHTEVSLSNEEILTYAARALHAQDHPSKDGINTYVVSKAARDQGLKVALSGVGGDELFAGYRQFTRMRLMDRLRWLLRVVPERVRSVLSAPLAAPDAPIALQKLGAAIRTDGSFEELYSVMRRFLFDGQIDRVLTDSTPPSYPYTSVLKENLAGAEGLSAVSKTSYCELQTYLHNTLLRDTDQMSMSHSLEVRVPLLDHELVEYMMGVDGQHQIAGDGLKQLLVDSLDGLLPEPIVDRPKQGFHMPFARWFRGPLKTIAEESLDTLAARPEFRGDELGRLWNQFLDGHAATSASRILLLVSLGTWMREAL